VTYAELAEMLGLTRAAGRHVDADPGLAVRRLDELERLLEDLMARLEEHRS
jgi:predicted transcriptional regulator